VQIPVKETTIFTSSVYHFISLEVKSIFTPCEYLQASLSRKSVFAFSTSSAFTFSNC